MKRKSLAELKPGAIFLTTKYKNYLRIPQLVLKSKHNGEVFSCMNLETLEIVVSKNPFLDVFVDILSE